MYQRFYSLPDNLSIRAENIHNVPVVDLGFQTAEERILSIMQAGQILQEARAEQHDYQNVMPDDDMSSHLIDIDIPVYADKFTAVELSQHLDDKLMAKLALSTDINKDGVGDTIIEQSEKPVDEPKSDS